MMMGQNSKIFFTIFLLYGGVMITGLVWCEVKDDEIISY